MAINKDDKTFFKTEREYKSKAEENKALKEEYEKLSGLTKAAIVLVSLGAQTTAKIFSKLDEKEIELLSTEVAKLENVNPRIKDMVLKEFSELLMAQKFVAQGGLEFAEKALIDALGPEKAKQIIEKVRATIRKTGFDMLNEIEPSQIVNFIQNEHPQTIALILAHLDPAKAGVILSTLSQDLQVEVVVRLATMKSISPSVIENVESVLQEHVKGLVGGVSKEIGGVKAVAEIMNMVEMSTEKNIMGTLERDNPELATAIKNLMFVFEDIILVDDRGIQRILREIDTKDLTLALKGVSEELKDKFLRNMSSRAAEMILEEMEVMGPVRLKDVEAAQQRIIEVVRRLEEEGEIIIAGRGGEDELIM